MDTSVEITGILSTIISSFYTSLVTSYGTIPALILCGLVAIGLYTVIKTTVSWLYNKIKGLFSRKGGKEYTQTPL